MFPPQLFPKLAGTGYTITSPVDNSYNCIAFAVGDQTKWWWPILGPAQVTEADAKETIVYWPPRAPVSESLDAFISALASLGFAPSEGIGNTAAGERVALYAVDGRVKHAARQMPNGRWRSKMGKSVDIEHELTAVEGPLYGTVAAILMRQRPS